MNFEQNNRTSAQARLLSIYKLITVGLAIVTVIASLLAYTSAMNNGSRFFNDSAASVILYVVLAIDMLFAFSALFLFKKNQKIESHSKLASYSAAIPCLASVLVLVWSFIDASKKPDNVWAILIALASVFSAFYFLAQIIRFDSTLILISGYVSIFLCLFIIAKLYVDLAIEMNSPVKLAIQFAAAAVATSILSDLRNLIDRPGPSQFVFSKVCTIMLALFCAAGTFTEAIESALRYGWAYVIYPIFLIAYAIFSSVELFTADVTEWSAPVETEPDNTTEAEASYEADVEAPEEGSEEADSDESNSENTSI